jgi:hypothetical protein
MGRALEPILSNWPPPSGLRRSTGSSPRLPTVARVRTIDAWERVLLRVTTKFKAKLHARFDAALQHLDELGREPNWKEEECLFHALSYMKRGSYKLADSELLELTGVFAEPAKYADAPATTRDRYTIALLRRGLVQLRAEGS